MYFVSEALSGAKLTYSELEKIAYAVIMAKMKLRHYFEAHYITVVIKKPLAELLSNREAPSRISKWVVELSSHNLSFQRRSAIKSQVLADFITDRTAPVVEPKVPAKQWVVFCD